MDPKKIRSARDLRDHILVLEESRIQQEYTIEDHWEAVKENYRPRNLVRRGLGNLIAEGKSKPNLFISALGLGLGFLFRRFIVGKSPNIARKLAGAAIQVGLSSFLAKNSSKEGTVNFFKRIFTKKKKPAILPG
jgi:hypothetical protein